MMSILYVVLFIVGLFIFLQLMLRARSWMKKGKPAPKVNGKLGQTIARGDKVIAYFFSPTCSACRAQEKLLPAVGEQFKNIFRVNAAKDRDVAQSFGIMGTPTTVVIEKGIIKDYFVGVTPPAKILKSVGIN